MNADTDRTPELSLILVSYNTARLLRLCLESIRRHAPNAEVIVADNDSRDGSPEMVAGEFPEVGLIRMGRNAGFAAANNAAIARSSGAFVVLLNSDTELEDDSLARCAAWMRAHPEVGATSPRLFGVDGAPQQCLHGFPSLVDALRKALRLGPRGGRADAPGWLAGTALMIRREALDSIGGGLDATYWMYWEDADLSSRLLEHGWQLRPFEGGWVRHHGGASGGGADANRRADLHAWYVFGKHRWYAEHRPRLEAAAVWCLDLLDVGRMWLRGTLHPARRAAKAHARATATVLLGRLIGRTPPVPG